MGEEKIFWAVWSEKKNTIKVMIETEKVCLYICPALT